MTPGSGSQAARVKRWLLWGVAAIVLVGGIWVVIQLTARDPRRHGDPGSMQEILLTGDSRQTSLEGLSAQLDTTRRENDRLRQDVARLEGQIAKTIEGVRGAFERELQSDRSRNEGERNRERQRLDREFGRLQGSLGQLGSDRKDADPTTDLAGFPPPPGRDPADSTPPPRRMAAAAGTPEVGPTPLDDAIHGSHRPGGRSGPDRHTAGTRPGRGDGFATGAPQRRQCHATAAAGGNGTAADASGRGGRRADRQPARRRPAGLSPARATGPARGCAVRRSRGARSTRSRPRCTANGVRTARHPANRPGR